MYVSRIFPKNNERRKEIPYTFSFFLAYHVARKFDTENPFQFFHAIFTKI